MRVKVWANGTNEAASFSLLRINTNEPIDIFHKTENTEKILDGEYYQCYSTPMFSIVRFDSSTKQGSKVMCEFDGNGIIMSFQKKGKTLCVWNRETGRMDEKQNNIFFHNGLTKCRLKEADCFRIVLSKSYVKALWNLYPKAMNPLMADFRECKNCVFAHSHLNTTFEMERIINDIENLYLQQEEGKEMVIEAKVRELLYSQIMHHLKSLDKKGLKIEKYREQMQEACKYIEKNIKELPSLHEIAMAVGVCDTTLKIAFKYFYGKTVFEYFNEYRLNKACEFLQDTSNSISDAAFLTGYKHSSHFSTAFKQKYGVSPIEYRTKNIDVFSAIKAR